MSNQNPTTQELRDRYLSRSLGPSGRIAQAFIHSKLTPLIILFALFLGWMAMKFTPREEEPQIIVPMVDVFVSYPGASSAEVERLVATPMEKLLWEMPGLDHIYTISRPGGAMAIVRFDVGEDEEASLVKVYNKMMGNMDRIPVGVSPPLIKLRGIDDVPIMAVTLHSTRYDSFMLRQVAGELATEMKKIPDISETTIIGGQRRQVRVEFDPARLVGHGLTPLQFYEALARDNSNLPAGSFDRNNQNVLVEVGDFFRNAREVERTVVAVNDGKPVYLADVADVIDGPEEVKDYVFFRPGAGSGTVTAASDTPMAEEAAVTIAVAKRRGANATWLTDKLKALLDRQEGRLLVSGVDYTITRDYGHTARDKSDGLMRNMLEATIAVILLMGIFLGVREAAVVAVAIPVTLGLTLFASYFFDYTLNRITLFALIFSIGILVDDAIVIVENINRHVHLGWGEPNVVAPYAVDEVGNPTILATFAVVFALLPMAFVSGMMGPYMSPIPVNASAAMLFSLGVAFVVTPWLTNQLLNLAAHFGWNFKSGHEDEARSGRIARFYRAIMLPLVEKPRMRRRFMAVVLVALFAAVSLFYFRVAKVKMLPHDNKAEFQVIIDMDEGTTLEGTAALTREIADRLADETVVKDMQLYVGTAAPINFNGLVRHYFLRSGPNQADIQVNLVGKNERSEQSHDIARRLRPVIQEISARHNATVAIAEVPPGPPVLSTMVAEVYGPDQDGQYAIAEKIRDIWQESAGVVDVDWYVEAPQPELRLIVEKDKAALRGVTTAQITNTATMALSGQAAGLVHTPREQEPVELLVRLPRAQRSSVNDLAGIRVRGMDGSLIPLDTLVRTEDTTQDKYIYHKDLRRVVYINAEVAGADESPVYGILDTQDAIAAIATPDGATPDMLYNAMPESETHYSVKMDGEWQITYEVFRDMGIAFGVVMILIYSLVVAWFRSFLTPLIIMAPIPLALIGIVPGHWLTGNFFTATSMIGFIALAGIVVRNSVLLVDFVEQERAAGSSLKDAVLLAGAIRFKAIVLTAVSTAIGGVVMLTDPIFGGLAVSLMFGVGVSTALTLVVIPLLYYVYQSELERRAAQKETVTVR
ncbi:MAG: efflux RND transporter permease subunit [Deltaproteobacteria bacterium]|nr:efflux RND transporter permease subunit [Deltaproteobacteria bacterium]MCB9487361.1 efflux RND transporter permease subunit [Deltaproteobacteria bacterium]